MQEQGLSISYQSVIQKLGVQLSNTLIENAMLESTVDVLKEEIQKKEHELQQALDEINRIKENLAK